MNKHLPTVDSLVASQAATTPDAIAVVCGNQILTYREMDSRAEELARHLLALGVGEDTVVALSLVRSPAMIVAALGILKAGGAYLPIDPSYPEARMAFLLEDAQVPVLITGQSLNGHWRSSARSVITLDSLGRLVNAPAHARDAVTTTIVDKGDSLSPRRRSGERARERGGPKEHRSYENEPLSPTLSPLVPRGAREHASLPMVAMPRCAHAVAATRRSLDCLAYVIYTSGSTGQPKGVEIMHSSLSNLVQWHQQAFRVTSNDRATQVARVSFDAAVWEIWPYLTAGASVHLAGEEMLNDPERLRDWMVAQAITISFVPTPIAERLLTLPWPSNTALRVMLTGADTLHIYPPADLPFLFVNNYGPTECTVVATSTLVPAGHQSDRLPPIGRPIANTKVYILDESLKPVTAGAPGELYLGGAGVARGYRNRPELTTEKFIPFGEQPGERLFKTGDLVRLLPDGQLAFLGRMDEQIKVRGFRVEPDEVAAALNEHPAVLQSVVVAREFAPGDRRLVAYLVAHADSRPSLAELRDFIAARLPDYMVPATFVLTETLPLTPNGKVDRATLPPPDQNNTLRDKAFTAPRTEAERTVANLLAPLLGLEQVDVEDNFFTIGGHSLLGTQLISRIRDTFQVELPLRMVFEAPTVAELSAEIERLLLAKLEQMSDAEAQSILNSDRTPGETATPM